MRTFRVPSEITLCNEHSGRVWKRSSDRRLSNTRRPQFYLTRFSCELNVFSRNMPPPIKRRRISDDDDEPTSSNTLIVPHVLQGEIARLDQKFKVSLDPSTMPTGKGVIKLVCQLDDKHLPCVPPISVVIPEGYPMISPNCKLIEYEYNSTPFLMSVQSALAARVSKLPKLFSLTHLLDTWEMAVRMACSPNRIQPTTTSVLMGVWAIEYYTKGSENYRLPQHAIYICKNKTVWLFYKSNFYYVYGRFYTRQFKTMY